MFEKSEAVSKKGMSELELCSIIEAQEKRALGYGRGELAQQRADALRHYNGEPLGNEIEGRSQVRTSEVFDTIEWILPSLLKIFTASDKAVEFGAERQSDEKGAKQSTLACNYVFYRQNQGFSTLYTFFKDALLEKNGYVEVYYDKSKRIRKESYQGLSQQQLTMLVSEPKVELLAATSYPDPTFPAPDPMAAAVGGAMQAPVQVPQLYDVKIQVEEEYGRVRIESVAPEEMLIDVSHKSVDLADCNFTARVFQKTISELEELGYDTSELVTTSGDDAEESTSQEYLARKQYNEELNYSDSDNEDRTMRKVWVTKAFIRTDFDGDGIAELRRVVKVGKVILENEEADVVPFASCTPIIQTHRHIGKSVAEIVMELEKIATTLTRQMLDNVYLTNAPRTAVQSTPEGAPMANLDDLLTVRPGGVVRYWGSQAPQPLEIPFMGQYGIQALEYMNTVKENRTGVTRYNQGVNADSLNKTAHGISQIMNASQQRIELIARVFAETGVKQIFKLIQHCLMTYHNKPMIVRLTDDYEEVDPREWSEGYDMVINVGLGTGDKQMMLEHLKAIADAQFQLIQTGLNIVTPKNIYNAQAKIAENAGFKSVEQFWTDPELKDGPPKPQAPPAPDPAVIAEQNKAQLEQAKLQQADQHKAMEAQQTAQLEQMKLVAAQQTEQLKIEAEKQLEAMRLQFEQWKVRAEIEGKVVVAQIGANASLEQAHVSAESKAVGELSDTGEKAEKPEGPSKRPMDTFTDLLLQKLQPTLAEHSQKIAEQGRGVAQIAQALSDVAGRVQCMGGKDVVQMVRLKGPDGRLAGVKRIHADGTTSEVAVQ